VSPAVDVRAADLAIVWAILDAHLPAGAVVRVFGSRARARARRGSDLDLAIDAGRPLTRAESHALADALEDCELPYTVDVVDIRTAARGFLAAIARDWTPLPDRPANVRVGVSGS
jgi:predicted nucleotidyltransferase